MEVGDKKQIRSGHFPAIDVAVTKWISDLRERRAVLAAPLILAKADSYPKQLNICDFTANEGWVAHVKKRHGLVHMGKLKMHTRIPKIPKSQVTALVTCSMTGDKCKMFVIKKMMARVHHLIA